MKNKWTHILCLLLVMVSCRKEFETPGWEMDVNAPLLYCDMGIEDLIPDSLMVSNADNSVNLVFDEKLFDFGIDSVVALPDSTIKDSFISIFNTYASPNFTVYTGTDNNELNIDGTELTRMILKQGFVDYSVTSNVEDTMLVTYTITTGTIAGAPIELNVTVPPAPSITSPITVSGVFSLAGSDLDLTGISHNTVNAYQTKMVVKTAPGTTGVNLTSVTSKVSFRAKFRDLVPSYVLGYFGNLIEQTPLETVDFDFFENVGSASLDLSQVNSEVYISNGLGADARITIDTLLAENDASGASVLLTHAAIGSAISINRAIDLGYAANPYVHTIDINSSNSNIESFLEALPQRIKYKLGVELNPLGNISAHTDFLYENSRVEAGLRVNIPLNIIASNFVIGDTIDFDLDNYDQNGKILRGKIRFNVSNGMPLGATFDVIMLDESNMSIGYLISGLQINGNTTSTSTSPGSPAVESIFAELNDATMESAYRAKKLYIRVRFNTSPDATFVNVYDTQRFKTQISVQADYLTQE